MVDPEIIKQLQTDLAPYKTLMAKVADTILDQEVSSYPIMVLHRQQPEIGITVVDKEQQGGNWSVNASTLEEFAMKRLIEDEKLDTFRSVFKNPRKHLCIFVLHEDSAGFVFVPRSEAEADSDS